MRKHRDFIVPIIITLAIFLSYMVYFYSPPSIEKEVFPSVVDLLIIIILMCIFIFIYFGLDYLKGKNPKVELIVKAILFSGSMISIIKTLLDALSK